MKSIKSFLTGQIIVGHSLYHDFKCLDFAPPAHLVRDTQQYAPFRKKVGRTIMALTHLCSSVLGENMRSGNGVHSSLEDAQVAMKLYRSQYRQWEHMVHGGSYRFSYAKPVSEQEYCLAMETAVEDARKIIIYFDDYYDDCSDDYYDVQQPSSDED